MFKIFNIPKFISSTIILLTNFPCHLVCYKQIMLIFVEIIASIIARLFLKSVLVFQIVSLIL